MGGRTVGVGGEVMLLVCCRGMRTGLQPAWLERGEDAPGRGREQCLVRKRVHVPFRTCTASPAAGLLGFPPKELQYRFLSQFKPVFYIRQRDYSKSVAVSDSSCAWLSNSPLVLLVSLPPPCPPCPAARQLAWGA